MNIFTRLYAYLKSLFSKTKAVEEVVEDVSEDIQYLKRMADYVDERMAVHGIQYTGCKWDKNTGYADFFGTKQLPVVPGKAYFYGTKYVPVVTAQGLSFAFLKPFLDAIAHYIDVQVHFGDEKNGKLEVGITLTLDFTKFFPQANVEEVKTNV